MLNEFQTALAYLAALSIVCLVLFSFTYFLPRPENMNKAKSSSFFQLLLVFVVASKSAYLFRYNDEILLSIILSNVFLLAMIYALMFAIYARYDEDITRHHYAFVLCHAVVLSLLLYYIHLHNGEGYWRAMVVLLNIAIPFGLTIKKCNQQFKRHRIGDKVLYSAVLLTLLLYLLYTLLFSTFFVGQQFMPLTIDFISFLTFVCILFFGFALSLIYSLIGKLRKEIITDRLTGAKNRNYFTDAARKLMSLSQRNQTPLSLIACDIDHFKQINDTYGHAAGDAVLVAFCQHIQNQLRTEDIFIRIGGEEFLILLPQIELKNAVQTAQRLCDSLAQLEISFNDLALKVSASFGVSEINTQIDINKNVNNADTALYEAKRSGRNKVVAFAH